MISVGLPVTKIDFLEDAIASILNQRFTDFELIIVNNEAPKGIHEILDKFKDDRIKYFENESRIPIIENWNKVLSYATREYFVLFSDDDIMEPEFLEEMIKLSDKYPDVHLFHARVRVIDSKNEALRVIPSAPEYESCADFIWHRIRSYREQFAQDFMIRTSELKKIGGFVDLPNAWGSDDATMFKIANINGVVATNKILINWRFSGENLASKPNIKEKLNSIRIYKNWIIDFINDELIYSNNEKYFKEDILVKLNERVSKMNANALSLLSNFSFSFIRIIYKWLILKKEYSLKPLDLTWAIGLMRYRK